MEVGIPLANEVVSFLTSGRFEQVRELFLPQLRPLVLPSAIATAWSEAFDDDSGPIVAGAATVGESRAGLAEIRVPLRASQRRATVVLSATSGGALAALRIVTDEVSDTQEGWQPPSYADPQRFEEVECRLGEPPFETPGTLSLPKVRGRRPGVLLLGGSGPVDRDGTLGMLKPLKDLAWGLASRGIAVLRFDKITHSHPEALQGSEVTIADEYLRHADSGLDALREHKRIDAKYLFLLGHSLGGTVAPRVALKHRDVAGIIILAGAAVPLHWTLVRQLRHSASLTPNATSPDDDRIGILVDQARLVDGPELTTSTSPMALPLGLPASYWLDLRNYRAPEVAASLPQPMLFLQGGRDYQSTVADDLALWQAALAHRSDVEIEVYRDDDHFFVPSGGDAPEGEGYARPNHVDEAVVRRCAEWIATVDG
jgi:dienelactone hydrolase